MFRLSNSEIDFVRSQILTSRNPDFNRVQFEAVRSEAGLNRFVMTPTKWIEQTKAII